MALAVWQATITNAAGDVQANAQIEVRNEATGALAAIYEDRDGEDALDNPFTADENGFARFYAAGGAYRIVASLGGFSRTYRHQSVGLLSEQDVVPDDQFYYRQTTAEGAAGVTPVDYSFPVGDIRRYGAVLDDSTDCLTALRAAAAVALAAGGGEIYIPGPVRTSNTIYITSNTRVYGDGFHCSVKPTSDVSDFDSSRIFYAMRDYSGGGESDDPSGGAFSDYYGPHENITIEDLYIEGANPYVPSVSTTRTGSAVQVQMCDGVNIRRLWVNGASDACIRVDGYGSGASQADQTTDFWANTFDVYIEDTYCENGFIGIELEGLVTRAWVRNNTIDACARCLRNSHSIESEWSGNKVLSVAADTIESSPTAAHMQVMRNGRFLNNTIDTGDADISALSIGACEDCSFNYNKLVEGHVIFVNRTTAGFTGTQERCQMIGNEILTAGYTYTPDSKANVGINARVGNRWYIAQNRLPNGAEIYVRPAGSGGSANGILDSNIATVDNGRFGISSNSMKERHTYHSNNLTLTNGDTAVSSSANGTTVIHPDGRKEAWHQVEVSLSAAASGSATWTFPTGSGAFNATPHVQATVAGTSAYFATVGTGDSDDILINVRHYEGTPDTTTVLVNVSAKGTWK